MPGTERDRIRLQHIVDAIGEIESYVSNTDFQQFLDNSMKRFACIKQLEVIGEASNHVSDEVKIRFSQVEWAQIVGMRNVFVHEYFGVDSNLVWEIIINDLPDLKEKVIEILRSI